MSKSWKPLVFLALIAVVALIVWRLLPGRSPVDMDGLTNATVDRLEREVDSLRAVVQQRDSVIVAYEDRIASLDQRLAQISERNGVLIENLNRQRRSVEHVSNDSLARDLNRILRSGLRAGPGPAAGIR